MEKATTNRNHTTVIGATSLSVTLINMAKNPQNKAVVAAYKTP